MRGVIHCNALVSLLRSAQRTLVVAPWILGGAVAQVAVQPLFDLEQGIQPVSSTPVPGVDLNGTCIFAASTLGEGRELWRTTPTGPQLLRDILPGAAGSNPREFAVFAGRAWFAASDGVHGTELWATDGTAAGTVMVADLEPGPGGSSPAGFEVCGTTMFFTAFEAGAGREPHATDGTAAGTMLVADVRPGRSGSEVDGGHHFTCIGGQVLFFADNGTSGAELHRTNGTPATTAMVVDLRPGPADGVDEFTLPVAANGRLYFGGNAGSGFEPCVSDGTAAGTQQLQNLALGSASSSPRDFFFSVVLNRVLFSASATGIGRELFASDGTAAGTVLVADILTGSSSGSPESFVDHGNQVLFAANHASLGRELFATDGTAAGTALLVDVRPGISSSFPSNLTECAGLVFFTATIAPGVDPFATDGTAAGTVRLADVFPGATTDQPLHLLCCDDRVWMQAPTPQGIELLESGGTVANTVVHDLEPAQNNGSSNPEQVRPIDGRRFYFVAETAANGREVCFFDGQAAAVLDLVPGPNGSSPRDLTVVGSTAYWTATTPATGRELFRSMDGGAPELVADMVAGSLSASPTELTAFDGDTLLFRSASPQGVELCEVTNGVAGVVVHDLAATGSSSPTGLSRIRDAATGAPAVVFAADDGIHGRELFAFTGGGIVLAKDVNPGPGSSSPFQLAVSRDGFVLVCIADNGQSPTLQRLTLDAPLGLAATDGPIGFPSSEALAGSLQSFVIRQLVAGNLGATLQAAMILEEIGFTANGTEVFALDAQGNFDLLADVFPGPGGSEPQDLHLLDAVLAWTADDGLHGREPIVYDIEVGSFVVHDLRPGHESSSPGSPVELGGELLLEVETQASDQHSIVRLGPTGTEAVFEIGWREPAVVGNGLVFAGDQGGLASRSR